MRAPDKRCRRDDIRLTEVATDTYQLTTYFPDIDFSLNQYVVLAGEPLLWHTGMRGMFGAVSETVAQVVAPERIRWVSFGHVEADECGSMNDWLRVAPQATVTQGQTGCALSIGDLADRAPRPLADDETLDIGGHRVRWLDTPHVPHNWEAGLLYDETTRTLFCGDLFSHLGAYAASIDDDLVGPAIAAEDRFPGASSLMPSSGDTIRRLAHLDVATIAPMHGPAYTGDCVKALLELANDFDRRVTAA